MTSIVYDQAGLTKITNPGAVIDVATPTANSSRVVVFDKISGIMNGIADGTIGQFLKTDGSGGLSWATGGGGGAVDIDGLADGYKVGTRLVLGSTVAPTNNNITIISPIFTGTVANDYNTFIGSVNASSIGAASLNTFIGVGNFSITNGNTNLMLGNFSLTAVTSGTNNISIGTGNGTSIISTNDNILIGNNVGGSIVTGANNLLIGHSNNVDIASRAGTIALGSNIICNVTNGFFIPNTTATLAANRIVLFSTASGQTGGMANVVNQTIASNTTTITITSLVQIVTFTGSFTGIILQAGSYNGQIAIVAIEPSSTGTLTLDTTPAISRVAGSNNASVNLYDPAGSTAKVFTYIWSTISALWIPTVN